jgi:predicted NUDIX family NTP pyrophosphohydrolase
LLLYRICDSGIEVLLVHPGGPLWAKKDLGAWSIPKGEADSTEDLLTCALREFTEETGWTATGPFTQLQPIKQTGKLVYAWAALGDGDASTIASNAFRLEYPPKSGRFREFPEVDKAEWFNLESAREKILKSQLPLLNQLEALIAS